MAQYFRIALHNAVYQYQLLSGKTGLSRVYGKRPCCVAENGYILGVNDACDKYHMYAGEPLSEALLQCADLYAEAPRFDIMRRGASAFLGICSRFGFARLSSFDECLLETDGIAEADIAVFTSEVRSAVEEELGIAASVIPCESTDNHLNPYSAHIDAERFSLEYLAEVLTFKLAVDNAGARMFSVEMTDKSGMQHRADQRVDAPCRDYAMLLFVLKNLLDLTVQWESITVNLYDICLGAEIPTAVQPAPSVREKNRPKVPWDYVSQNRRISALLNQKELTDFSKLTAYLKANPDHLNFAQLCALAEKATTRRLKLGNYYMNPDYAEKFVRESAVFEAHQPRVLVSGYCPLVLLFAIKERCSAKFYFSDIDERTTQTIRLLDAHSPCELLAPEAAEEGNYDISLSLSADAPFSAQTDILLVRKAFFSSEERKTVQDCRIAEVFDFGAYGFCGAAEQFAAIAVKRSALPSTTQIYSLDNDSRLVQEQKYFADAALPCWVLYRDARFDSVYDKLQFGLFDVQCSSQLKQRDYHEGGDLCVISSACIDSTGSVHLSDRCNRVYSDDISRYDIAAFAERDDVFVAAVHSTVLKVGRKPKGCIPNPSTILLVPKKNVQFTDEDLRYFSTPEFKNFYYTALNHQDFLLSSDYASQYFLGKVVS